ncbi:single-stranded-DNA-specific exonuclease RecJ [Aerococcaceae bacterium NML201209]|nr:single-stranded-DNA-specific exonuclease RecJ [Aerococcaceae bacterium NML201209]
MNLAHYHWRLPTDSSEITQIVDQLQQDGLAYSSAFLRLCVQRGFTSVEAIQTATNQEPQLFHDPFLLYDMERTVERLREAIENEELILIYGDYDADGITSTLILYEALETLGANVQYYLPNRLIDGYGPNKARYQAFVEEGIQLILTCDNGVAGHEAIEWAMQQGVDVIISDHHEIQETLPPAYAMIHPKHPQGDYPFGELSGAGVALKIATALLEEVPVEAVELAAIGTLSDMVSLTDENRTIVLSGLKLLNDTQRIGLQLLFEQEDITDVTTDTVGFVIGPRLNAIGRLGDPTPALELLRTFDSDEAATLLTLINDKNTERKAIVESITQEVTERLEQATELPPIIVEAAEHWSAGVLGIVASRIMERYQRPTILFQYQSECDWYKGSGRSPANVHLFHWLQTQSEKMSHFGGHGQAAGVTVPASHWQSFKQGLLNEASQFVSEDTVGEPLTVELALLPSEVSEQFVNEMMLLGPFGMNNPKPLVMLQDVVLQDFRFIGADKTHVKLSVGDTEHQVNAIGFSMAPRFVGLQKGDTISLVAELSLNEWQNQVTPQLMLKDIGITGVHWLDYRSSQIDRRFFEQEAALYLFQNQSLLTHYAEKLSSSCRASTYREAIKETDLGQQTLIIVEPPQHIEWLHTILKRQPWQKIILGAYVTESKYLVGEPTRQEFAKLYRWLQQQAPFGLRQRLPQLSQQFNLPITKLKLMFHVFFEAKFVTIEDGLVGIQPTNAGQHVDLFNLPAMTAYREAMHAESILIYQSLNEIKEYFK